MFLQKVISRKTFGFISKRHGSPDPDPYKNVMDPQHGRAGGWFPIRSNRKRGGDKHALSN